MGTLILIENQRTLFLSKYSDTSSFRKTALPDGSVSSRKARLFLLFVRDFCCNQIEIVQLLG